ncbi:MAG: hypothetical protein ACLT4C_05410 [Butyricicoccus sp.]
MLGYPWRGEHDVCITVMPRFLRLFTDSEQVAEMGTQYASIAFAFSVIIMVGLHSRRFIRRWVACR